MRILHTSMRITRNNRRRLPLLPLTSIVQRRAQRGGQPHWVSRCCEP